MMPKWLAWVQQLQAISQIGLTYATDPFDVARYEAVREIAAEIAVAPSHTPVNHIRDLFAQEVGYATAKVDVRGAVFRDDAILLSRNDTMVSGP